MSRELNPPRHYIWGGKMPNKFERYRLISSYCKNNPHLLDGKKDISWLKSFSKKTAPRFFFLWNNPHRFLKPNTSLSQGTSIFRTCFYYYVSNICHNILLGRRSKVKVKTVHASNTNQKIWKVCWDDLTWIVL